MTRQRRGITVSDLRMSVKVELEDVLQCRGPRWVDVIGKQDSGACLEQLLDDLHKEL